MVIPSSLRAVVLFLTGVFCTTACSAQSAGTVIKGHRDYRADGVAAYKKKDYAAARAAFTTALELRPDSPRYLYNLAAVSALAGDLPAALSWLQRLAKLGVFMPVGKDPDFAALQGTPAFADLVRTLEAHREPKGTAEVMAELPGRTGIIEGIAYHERTGDLFLSDVHHRSIWKRDLRGQLTRYSADDEELFGVFGLAVDDRRNTLWAATAALPEMSGFSKEMKGLSGLAEFNLATSELRQVIPVPGDGRDHQLGDLVVTPEGTVYATDGAAPIIWRFTAGSEELEKFVESREFSSLQGIVYLNRQLIVADYSNGLFVIDPATTTIRALAPPPQTTLLGLDGLVAIPGGLVATQNGVDPARVLRVDFTPDLAGIRQVTVLASGLTHFTDLTLVTLVQDRPTVIANAGWQNFDPGKSPHPAARTVRIFQVALP